IRLSLRLLHGLPDPDDNQNDPGGTGHKPLLVDDFHVLNVDALGNRPLKNDGGVFAERFEGDFVAEGKRGNSDANANLAAAAGAPLRLHAAGQFPEEVADGSEDALLLDADGG